jgi:hypothetical protein
MSPGHVRLPLNFGISENHTCTERLAGFGHQLDDDLLSAYRPIRGGALLIVEVEERSAGRSPGPALVDAALSGYANLLTPAIRTGDTLYRIGDDKLGLVCLGVPDWQALSMLLDRLRDLTNSLTSLPDWDGYATVSITAVLAEDAAHGLRLLEESAERSASRAIV